MDIKSFAIGYGAGLSSGGGGGSQEVELIEVEVVNSSTLALVIEAYAPPKAGDATARYGHTTTIQPNSTGTIYVTGDTRPLYSQTPYGWVRVHVNGIDSLLRDVLSFRSGSSSYIADVWNGGSGYIHAQELVLVTGSQLTVEPKSW